MSRPTDLDRARRAVDALGGTWPRATHDYERGKQNGYDMALDLAVAAITRLGGRDHPDVDKIVPRTPQQDFHNRLRILHSIDNGELERAGLDFDTREWNAFMSNPFRWFIAAGMRMRRRFGTS